MSMADKGKMGRDVSVVLMSLIVLSAIGLVVTLNGGPISVVVSLLIGCLTCIACIVFKAVERRGQDRRTH